MSMRLAALLLSSSALTPCGTEPVADQDSTPAETNNTGFQNARTAAKLEKVCVHDLRHTYGQRLRNAGVSEEDRSMLLGHTIAGMAQHNAAAAIARLADVTNKVSKTPDRTTVLRIVNT